ncbi:hypothetical protein JCM11641_001711 [Rhodosporidiobolus odoratus]
MGAASSQVSSDPRIIALAVDAFRIKMLAQTPETGQPAEAHHIDAYVQPIRKALEEVWQADLQQADRGEAAGAYRRILGRVPERIPKKYRMQTAQYSYRSGRYDRDSEIWSPDNAIHSIADLDLQDTDLEPVLVACYLSKGFIHHILHQLRDLRPPLGAWPTNMWYNEAMKFVDSEWSLWRSIDRAKNLHSTIPHMLEPNSILEVSSTYTMLSCTTKHSVLKCSSSLTLHAALCVALPPSRHMNTAVSRRLPKDHVLFFEDVYELKTKLLRQTEAEDKEAMLEDFGRYVKPVTDALRRVWPQVTADERNAADHAVVQLLSRVPERHGYQPYPPFAAMYTKPNNPIRSIDDLHLWDSDMDTDLYPLVEPCYRDLNFITDMLRTLQYRVSRLADTRNETWFMKAGPFVEQM